MNMEDRDIVVFEDEEGNKIELDVVRYFEHKGVEYAILMDFEEECDEHEECDCDHCDVDMYVMKIVDNGEFEEFVPVEEEMFDEILDVVDNLPDEE